VWAEVRRPDQSVFNVAMSGTEDEPYSGTFKTSVPGVYTIRVRAQGETVYGSRFTREQTMTAVAVPGGGRTPVEPTHDRIADLLCCLFPGGRMPDRLRKEVEDRGIDPGHLMQCLRRLCVENDEATRERKRQKAAAPAAEAGLRAEVISSLRALVDRLGTEE
jgi:hypothetical protein